MRAETGIGRQAALERSAERLSAERRTAPLPDALDRRSVGSTHLLAAVVHRSRLRLLSFRSAKDAAVSRRRRPFSRILAQRAPRLRGFLTDVAAWRGRAPSSRAAP